MYDPKLDQTLFYDQESMAERCSILAHNVAAVLRDAGHAVFLVGGCVRDRLLGRPVKDYDLATDATPDRLRKLFPGALEVGAHFGVILVRENGDHVEVATFRSDHAYEDGRRPSGVTFETDPRQDALRRDFTINALFEDPFSGDILDFTGGRADLEQRCIHAIGDPAQRFDEDHLRLLRAVRFAAQLGFEIEPETQDAIQRMASLINRVSAERIRDELAMILTEGSARRGFELLDETGLLRQLLPEISAMHGVAQPPQFHPEGDVWIHTMLMLEQLEAGASIELALATLLHDVAKPVTATFTDRIRFNGHAEKGAEMAAAILTRLRFPNDVIDTVSALVKDHMRFLSLPKMRPATVKRFFRQPHFPQQLELYRLDLIGSLRPVEWYDEVKARRSSMSDDDLRPQPLLTGDDLIALGYRPGPLFRRILSHLEDAQLEGRIRTHEDALIFVQREFDLSAEAG